MTPASLPSANRWPSNELNAALQPAEDVEVVALLTACLALVKAVGMREADAQAWLNIAADTIGHLPCDLLEHACRVAQQSCTHHGQIVPRIIKETEEAYEARKRMAARPRAVAALPSPAASNVIPWRPASREEIEEAKREAAEWHPNGMEPPFSRPIASDLDTRTGNLFDHGEAQS
jgi:hypothetical protein